MQSFIVISDFNWQPISTKLHALLLLLSHSEIYNMTYLLKQQTLKIRNVKTKFDRKIMNGSSFSMTKSA